VSLLVGDEQVLSVASSAPGPLELGAVEWVKKGLSFLSLISTFLDMCKML